MRFGAVATVMLALGCNIAGAVVGSAFAGSGAPAMGEAAKSAASAEALRVVVTIKPVHALAAALLAGVAEPVLLVDGQQSPHTFTLKPSAARAAQDAQVLIRVAPTVEPFTTSLAKALPAGVRMVTLADVPGLTLLDLRKGESFEPHAHGDAGHDGDKHDHDHAHDHGEHAHEDGAARDGHIWLDPDNARRIAAYLAAEFTRLAPASAARIAANAASLDQQLAELARTLEQEMKPLHGKPFLVFHDAIHYFEHRFDLDAIGAITVSPEVQPSARRLTALRRRIGELGPVCVFAEPQFQGGLIAAVTEGTGARSGIIDPEGALLTPGPELYFTLMRNLAASLSGCLGAAR